MTEERGQIKPVDIRRERLEDMLVVDVDVHLHESAAEILIQWLSFRLTNRSVACTKAKNTSTGRKSML
jgi:hypothetical protein